MTVNMTKGQAINLQKSDGGTLTAVRMGLGWQAAPRRGLFGSRTREVDLDASAVLFARAGPGPDPAAKQAGAAPGGTGRREPPHAQHGSTQQEHGIARPGAHSGARPSSRGTGHMTAELVRGQNHTLPQTRLEIRVSAGTPVVAGATLGDERGTVRGIEWIAHPGSPQLPGLEVSQQAAADHRLAVDLEALPAGVHRVTVLLALPVGVGGPVRFGAVPAPFVAVTGLDGSEIATFTLTDLDAESAVSALELYRRQDAWKVRAVGQGYAGGLAEMLADQGVTDPDVLAGSIQEAVTRGLARSVAPPPPRTPEGDRVRHATGSADHRPTAPPPAPE
ncbi:TerD family protein, partial [Streptomyces globisporus]